MKALPSESKILRTVNKYLIGEKIFFIVEKKVNRSKGFQPKSILKRKKLLYPIASVVPRKQDEKTQDQTDVEWPLAVSLAEELLNEDLA